MKLQMLSTVFLLLGFLLTGVLGTDTSLLFFWPGCIALGLAGVVATLGWRMRVYSAPSDWCLLSVVALAVYLVSRGLASPVTEYARQDAVMVLAGLVVYVLAATSLSHPKWRMAMLLVLVLLLLGNLMVGFVHFSGRWAFHVVPSFARTFSEGRVGGFFNNANHLGAFLSMSFLLLLGIVFFGRSGVVVKLLLAFLCVAVVIELRLTLSRAALLGAGAGAGLLVLISLWLVWRSNRPLFGMILSGGLVVAVLSGVVVYQVGAESLRRRMANSPVENDVRFSIWRSALEQHKLAPVTGTGSRTFEDYGIMLRDPLAPGHQRDPIFVHNEYLQLLADYGWAGVALMGLAIALHLGNGLRFVRWFASWRFPETGSMRSDSLALSLGAFAALVAGLVQAVFEFHFHVPALVLLAAFCGGVLMNPGYNLESHQPRRIPGLRPLSKLLAGTAALLLLAASARFGPTDLALSQAEIARERGDREDETYWLERALKSEAENGEAYYRMGLLLLEGVEDPLSEEGRSRLMRAHGFLERAVQINPLHYLYHVALTDVLDVLGREEEALASARMAVRTAPQHEEARLALALHQTRFGKFEEAERTFLWVQKASAQNAPGEMTWFDYYREMLELAQRQAQAVLAK